MTEQLDPKALDRMREAVAEVISETTYTCSRVWEAWHYGTMTDEDFSPAWEDGVLLTEIVQAVLAALPAPRTIETVEGLEALPFETIVLDAEDDHMKRVSDGEGGAYWERFGDTWTYPPEDVCLPARVLWVPKEGGGE